MTFLAKRPFGFAMGAIVLGLGFFTHMVDVLLPTGSLVWFGDYLLRSLYSFRSKVVETENSEV
jgi:hypothetical protein